MLVIAGVGVLAWSVSALLPGSDTPDTPGSMSEPQKVGAVAHDDVADAPVIHAGMSADEVRAIEGEPTWVHGDLWEYGPSWIRFDHDEVVEWHSSPLRTLHTGTKAVQDANQ